MDKILIGLILTFIILAITLVILILVIPEYDKIFGTIAGILGIFGIGFISKLYYNNNQQNSFDASNKINGGGIFDRIKSFFSNNKGINKEVEMVNLPSSNTDNNSSQLLEKTTEELENITQINNILENIIDKVEQELQRELNEITEMDREDQLSLLREQELRKELEQLSRRPRSLANFDKNFQKNKQRKQELQRELNEITEMDREDNLSVLREEELRIELEEKKEIKERKLKELQEQQEEAYKKAEEARKQAEEVEKIREAVRIAEGVRQQIDAKLQSKQEEKAIVAKETRAIRNQLNLQRQIEARKKAIADEESRKITRIVEEARVAEETKEVEKMAKEIRKKVIETTKQLEEAIEARKQIEETMTTRQEAIEAIKVAEEKEVQVAEEAIEAVKVAEETARYLNEKKIQTQEALDNIIQIKRNTEIEVENIENELNNQTQEIINESNNIITEIEEIKNLENKNPKKIIMYVNILKKTDKLKKFKKPKIMKKQNIVKIDKTNEFNNKLNKVIEICKEFYNMNINNTSVLSILDIDNLFNYNLFINTCFDSNFIDFLNNLDDNIKSSNQSKINDLIENIHMYYKLYIYKTIHYNLLSISNINDKIKSINDIINQENAIQKIETINGYYQIKIGKLIDLYPEFIKDVIEPWINRIQDQNSTEKINELDTFDNINSKNNTISKKSNYLWADYEDFVSETGDKSWDFYTRFKEYNENETMKIEDYDVIISNKINSNINSIKQEVNDIRDIIINNQITKNKQIINSKEQNLIDKLNRVLSSSDNKIQYIKIQSTNDLNLVLCVSYIEKIREELNLLIEVKTLVENTKNEKIKKIKSTIDQYIKNCENFINECNKKITETSTKPEVPADLSGPPLKPDSLTPGVPGLEELVVIPKALGTPSRAPGTTTVPPRISSVIYDSGLPLISATTPFKKIENKNTEFDKYLNNLLNSSI